MTPKPDDSTFSEFKLSTHAVHTSIKSQLIQGRIKRYDKKDSRRAKVTGGASSDDDDDDDDYKDKTSYGVTFPERYSHLQDWRLSQHDQHENKFPLLRKSKSAVSSSPEKYRHESALSKLKMDTYPNHWYTSVLPAYDIYVSRQNGPVRMSYSPESSSARSRARSRERVHTPGRSTASTPSPSRKVREKVTTLMCNTPPSFRTRRQLVNLFENSRGRKFESFLERCQRASRNNDQILREKVKDFLRKLADMHEFKN